MPLIRRIAIWLLTRRINASIARGEDDEAVRLTQLLMEKYL